MSVPARGSVRTVVHDMLKHLCSAISYGGARSLGDCRRGSARSPMGYVVRLTEASRLERSSGRGTCSNEEEDAEDLHQNGCNKKKKKKTYLT